MKNGPKPLKLKISESVKGIGMQMSIMIIFQLCESHKFEN